MPRIRLATPCLLLALLFLNSNAYCAENSQIPTLPQKALTKLCRKSDLIVLGRLVKLGPPPGWVASLVMSNQYVIFKVEESIKGSYANEYIKAYFTIYFYGWEYEKDPTHGLSRKIFKKGQRFILFLSDENKGNDGRLWISTESRPFSKSLLTQVRLTLIRAKSSH